jgi:hypothetical protein
MFAVLCTKRGHFDGMTSPLVEKRFILAPLNKWGQAVPLTSAQEAHEFIEKEKARHKAFLLSAIDAADQREPGKSHEAGLRAIHPLPSYSVVQLTEI